MPDISSLGIPRYKGSDPYYYAFDNKPLDVIEQILNLINSQVDINTQSILDAGGSYTLSQRLNISIYDNGSLKPSSIDTAFHNIGHHSDGSYTVSSSELTAYQSNYPSITNPVPFVRMLKAERDKLSSISSDANSLNVSILDNNTSTTVVFNDGNLPIKPSSTIIWKVAGTYPNQEVTAEVTSSLSSAHEHYDNTLPTSASLTPDFMTYLVNGPAFIAGSLKVYINGVRLFPYPYSVYVPSSDPSLPWLLNSFTENGNTGFVLTNKITQDDIIVVDFTVALS
jgi:hypothetical protein